MAFKHQEKFHMQFLVIMPHHLGLNKKVIIEINPDQNVGQELVNNGLWIAYGDTEGLQAF